MASLVDLSSLPCVRLKCGPTEATYQSAVESVLFIYFSFFCGSTIIITTTVYSIINCRTFWVASAQRAAVDLDLDTSGDEGGCCEHVRSRVTAGTRCRCSNASHWDLRQVSSLFVRKMVLYGITNTIYIIYRVVREACARVCISSVPVIVEYVV